MMPGVARELRKDHERIVARRHKVKILIHEGRSHTDIAAIIGVTERTVERDRVALGMAERNKPRFLWNQHTEWLARNLIADECPIAEIARSIGACDHHVVRRHFRDEIPPGWIGGDPLVSHRRLARELGLLMRPRRAGRYSDHMANAPSSPSSQPKANPTLPIRDRGDAKANATPTKGGVK